MARTPHGTVNYYVNGHCRCRACRTAWREYVTARRRGLGIRPRGDRRFYVGTPGRRGFDPFTERVLDAVEKRTGRSWRDVVGAWARTRGAAVVTFPDLAADSSTDD